jgi:hypothetical protein
VRTVDSSDSLLFYLFGARPPTRFLLTLSRLSRSALPVPTGLLTVPGVRHQYQYKIIGDHANSHNSYLSVRSCISTKTCSNCLNESSF